MKLSTLVKSAAAAAVLSLPLVAGTALPAAADPQGPIPQWGAPLASLCGSPGDANAAGYNVILGNAANNTLTGTPQNDAIFGFAGDDKISGRGGNDLLCGHGGKDRLRGDDGHDTEFGHAGEDGLSGENGFDYLNGGPVTPETCVVGPGGGVVVAC